MDQLPTLEYVMRNNVPVTDVGTMMGGAGYRADVFAAAANFLKKQAKEYVLVLHKQIPLSCLLLGLHLLLYAVFCWYPAAYEQPE